MIVNLTVCYDEYLPLGTDFYLVIEDVIEHWKHLSSTEICFNSIDEIFSFFCRILIFIRWTFEELVEIGAELNYIEEVTLR